MTKKTGPGRLKPRLHVQIHGLFQRPCSNLNRDESGRPKSIMLGNTRRTRMTAQSIKRSMRDCDLYREFVRAHQERLGVTPHDALEVPSKSVMRALAERLIAETGLCEALVAAAVAPWRDKLFGGQACRIDGADPLAALDGPVPAKLGPRETAFIEGELLTLLNDTAPDQDPEEVLSRSRGRIKQGQAALREMGPDGGLEMALFGRYTSGELVSRQKGAVTISHAIGVHEARFETDDVAATDPLWEAYNTGVTRTRGTYDQTLTDTRDYLYAQIDTAQLSENLGLDIDPADDPARNPDHPSELDDGDRIDREAVAQAVEMMVELFAHASATGKLGQTASVGRAAFVMIEIGEAAPHNLVSAFDHPCTPDLEDAARRLADHIAENDRMYGRRCLRAYATRLTGFDADAANAKDLGTVRKLARLAGDAIRRPDEVRHLLPRDAELTEDNLLTLFSVEHQSLANA